MPILPIKHADWQTLRAAKRARKAVDGRALRVNPTHRTKDGAFLTELVQRGLLAYASGGPDDPFAATYTLTPLGEHAAEYGECEMPLKLPAALPPPNSTVPGPKGGPKPRRDR